MATQGGNNRKGVDAEVWLEVKDAAVMEVGLEAKTR